MNIDEAIRRLKALLALTPPESPAALELIEVLKLLDPELRTENK